VTPTVRAGLAMAANGGSVAIGRLLDAEQAWVTGQVIGVDGGLSRVRPRS
jgi:hypothetical protein